MKCNSGAVGVGVILGLLVALHGAPARAQLLPVRLRLERPATVTVVIDDAAGRRVRNLLSATRLPAGEHTLYWDGYDEGAAEADPATAALGTLAQSGDAVRIVRRRAPAGTYRVHGLVHDGIVPRYEFSVYSPGTPPWFTLDGAGAWLGDHSAPSAVVCLPAGDSPHGEPGQAQMLLGCICAEMGHAVAFVDLDGRKRFGSGVGYGSWGPKVLARDTGPAAAAGTIAYGVAFDRFIGFGRDGSVQTLCTWSNQGFKALFQEGRDASLAVRDGLAVISTRLDERLTFIAVAKPNVVGTLRVPSPRGVAFDDQGRLYLATGQAVKRYAVALDPPRLEREETVVASGLSDPCQLLLDGRGELLVSDWGTNHQVRVFGLDGTRRRTIGRPGGAQPGRYDEQRMGAPYQMALDPNGVLWVAESEYAPKRVSLWDAATGRFLRAIYGGPRYAAGGQLDPQDPTRFWYSDHYVNGCSGLGFRLDWKAGAATLTDLYFRGPRLKPEKTLCDFEALYRAPYGDYDRTSYAGDLPAIGDRVAERPVRVGGHTFLVDGRAIWRVGDDGLARQVAGFCLMNQFFQPGIGWSKHILPERLAPIQERMRDVLARSKDDGMLRYLCAWSDADADGAVDAEEVQARYIWPHPMPPLDEGMAVGEGLSVALPGGGALPAPKLNERGIPLYDLAQLSWCLAAGDPLWNQVGLIAATNGWRCGYRAGFRNGSRQWSFRPLPNRHLPQQPGDIVQPLGYLGPAVRPARGEAGELYGFFNYWGAVYLMTLDGLLVQTLGGDCRTTPLWRTNACPRGLAVEGVSFDSEHFYPSMTQMADGTVYLVAGKEHSSILRLDGFEAVRRCEFGSVTVTGAVAGAAAEWVETLGGQDRQTLAAALVRSAPKVDGVLEESPLWEEGLDEWPAWVELDRQAAGSIVAAGGDLCVAWRTGDPDLLRNAGSDPDSLFTTGGALDLMLRPARYRGPYSEPAEVQPGDLRLVVTRVSGQTRAVLYRVAVPGASGNRRVQFESPVGKVVFDEVRDVSDQVRLAGQGGNYELAVPLALLGLTVEPRREVLGDIGLLRGNGQETVQRVYWNNKGAQIVSDLPSEARLEPVNWGVWRFDAPPRKAEREPSADL